MLADRRIRTSLVALLADSLLVGIKLLTAWTTGSAALLADAYHSITDLAVSLILLSGLATRHFQEKKGTPAAIIRAYRFESVLAILVALLILYVPIEILQEIQQHPPEELRNLWVGILGVLLCIAIAYFMSKLKTLVGRDTDSPALEADGYHSRMDVFSSLAVLASLIGAMIGIYLDETVAVIIAVMVAVAGLELLVSGVRSLLQGGQLQQLSLLESLLAASAGSHIHRIGSTLLSAIRHGWRRTSKPALLALALLGYALSGFTTVPHGYTGIQQTLNRSMQTDLPPGLHYALPWPLGNIRLLPSGEIYSLEIGQTENSTGKATEASNTYLWRQAYLNDGDEAADTMLLSTSDENLVNIRLSLHYRLPAKLQLQSSDATAHALAAHFAEAALWRQVARHTLRELLETDHDELARQTAADMRTDLQTAGLDISVIDAQIQSIQLPARVVTTYRDAQDAQQEKRQLEQAAEGQRLTALSEAATEQASRAASATARQIEQKLYADGDGERFQQLSSVFRQHPDVIRFNQYLDTVTQKLTGKPLIITDPGIQPDDLRVWKPLPAPDKTRTTASKSRRTPQ